MARTDCLTNFLIDVSDSIKEKKKDNTPIKACNFDEEIKNLNVGGGVDLSEYFGGEIEGVTTAYNNQPWINVVKKITNITIKGTTAKNLFHSFKGTEIDLSNINKGDITIYTQTFYGNGNLIRLDLSGFYGNTATNTNGMLDGCKSLQYLDIRNLDFSNVTDYKNMFGGDTTGVPGSCLIIVKDEIQKTWITTNFTKLTNVKTVAEYEEIGG